MELHLPIRNSEEKILIDFDYKTKMSLWDKFASIRSRPRRIMESGDQKDYFYPIQRKPICAHPLVRKKGDETIYTILTQSAYKFMSDIAFVEVEIINRTASKIYTGSLAYIFPTSLRYDLLSVIIDEAYHAYVAIDFMEQIQAYTKIKPLKMTSEVELQQSLGKFINFFQGNCQDIFEIIAICIGENTLTKELFNMTKDTTLNKIFHHVMSDHMIDEGRHSEIFSIILKELWQKMPDSYRNEIGMVLPRFIIDYLKPDLHIEFDKLLLSNAGLSDKEINQIIDDTYGSYTIQNLKIKNPIFDNIIKVLTRARIFDHELTVTQFKLSGLL